MATTSSIPDAHITLASLTQDYEQILTDYVASDFRRSFRTLLDEEMIFIIDTSFATGILSFSATRTSFNDIQCANGRVISLYQLAMFMDTIENSWSLEEEKVYIQEDDFNDLDKEFLILLGLTVLNTKLELRNAIEETARTSNKTFCFTGQLESRTTASFLYHIAPDLYIGRELEDIARQIGHVCDHSCPPVCTVFMMDYQQLRPCQESE